MGLRSGAGEGAARARRARRVVNSTRLVMNAVVTITHARHDPATRSRDVPRGLAPSVTPPRPAPRTRRRPRRARVPTATASRTTPRAVAARARRVVWQPPRARSSPGRRSTRARAGVLPSTPRSASACWSNPRPRTTRPERGRRACTWTRRIRVVGRVPTSFRRRTRGRPSPRRFLPSLRPPSRPIAAPRSPPPVPRFQERHAPRIVRDLVPEVALELLARLRERGTLGRRSVRRSRGSGGPVVAFRREPSGAAAVSARWERRDGTRERARIAAAEVRRRAR